MRTHYLLEIVIWHGQKEHAIQQNGMLFYVKRKCADSGLGKEAAEMEAKMDYINAFWVGGLVCALVQILLEKTKLMPGRIMVLLVVTGAVISVLGWYEPFQEYAGAGASVPLLGFGNLLMKGVKEAVDQQGFLGLFQGGFKAGAVGSSAALIFGYLASLIFQSKPKS